MATQISCIIPAPGADIVLQDRPVPTAGPGQLLVKINATALNPVDNMHRYFPVLISGYPAVLGCDAAGTVEALGEGASGFNKGDRVFFQASPTDDGATFQQYATVMSKLAAKIPSNITDEQASTMPTSIVTAAVLLFNNTPFAPPFNEQTATGAPVLILGGSGSVGRACIQMARIAGFSPIITTASKTHTESLKSLGATHVFERTVSVGTIHEALKAANKGPLKLAVDTVSNSETQVFACEVLTTQSNPPYQELQLQLVLPPTDQLKEKNNALGEGRIKAEIVAGVAHKQPDVLAPFWAVAENWLGDGTLVPGEVKHLPGGLGSVKSGLDMLAGGVSGIKLVVNP
ncbi:Zinc-binding dehydrogenase [Ceratobasidium sp. AG-Ba]|nr:Zinc-binding dehydrogenase [Ceratobasidium sp. AG-Ba]